VKAITARYEFVRLYGMKVPERSEFSAA